MILEFKCKNFRSIKDEILFSMLASNDDSNSDFSFIDVKDYKVLKKAIVYGPNGAGKSNFIKALMFMKALVINSQNHMPNVQILAQPHKLDPQSDTFFSIQFIDKKQNRYYYSFSFNKDRITSEMLYHYPNGRAAKIFTREGMETDFSANFKSQLSFVANQTLKENRLFLSCATKDSNVVEISDVYSFFSEDLVFYPNDDLFPNDSWKIYSAEVAQNFPPLKDEFVKFTKELGSLFLKDVVSAVETKKIEEKNLPPFLNDVFKKQLLEGEIKEPKVDFVYEKFPIRLEEESLGNQKLFEMFFPLFDVLQKGKVFICDEFERSLHPLVVQKLISVLSHNTSGAQFILTTHDVGLLNPEFFRRDEIWFVEMKNSIRSTDIYSLAELKSIRKGEIYSKNYIFGKYSAIPVISNDLEKLLIGD